jgi:hypothetical protein
MTSFEFEQKFRVDSLFKIFVAHLRHKLPKRYFSQSATAVGSPALLRRYLPPCRVQTRTSGQQRSPSATDCLTRRNVASLAVYQTSLPHIYY